MDFTVRDLQEEDLPMLKNWWKWWRFGDVHRLMLPDNIKSSVMLQYKNRDIFCGFIYRTSASKLFHIEFIVSDPMFKDKVIRKKAKTILVKMLIETCKEMGAVVIYTNLKNEGLIPVLLENGFVVGSSNTQEMVYVKS